MVTQAEQEQNSDTAQSNPPPSNKELWLLLASMKLKLIGGYILDGVVPAIAVIALIVAAIAVTNNKSSHAELDKSTAAINSLNASLVAAKNEIELLKTIAAREKNYKETDSKKQDELMAKVVQNISQLQIKMKISPTLDEQMHQSASAPSAASSVAGMATAAPAATHTPANSDKKIAPQGQVLTKAIEKFNDKNHK